MPPLSDTLVRSLLDRCAMPGAPGWCSLPETFLYSWLFLLLEPVLIAACFLGLRRTIMPTIHAVVGACVLGDALFLAALLPFYGTPHLVVGASLQMILPPLLLGCCFAGTLMGRGSTLALWSLILFEVWLLRGNGIMAVTTVTGAVFASLLLRMGFRLVAIGGLIVIALGLADGFEEAPPLWRRLRDLMG